VATDQPSSSFNTRARAPPHGIEGEGAKWLSERAERVTHRRPGLIVIKRVPPNTHDHGPNLIMRALVLLKRRLALALGIEHSSVPVVDARLEGGGVGCDGRVR
jgi:hypothetical protein